MKLVSLYLLVISISLPALAAPKHDYSVRDDLADSCAQSVMEVLEADQEVSSYLEDQMTVSLEWWDKEKSQVAFEFYFNPEEVRDGYMVGQVSVENSGSSCRALKVVNSSVGD